MSRLHFLKQIPSMHSQTAGEVWNLLFQRQLLVPMKSFVQSRPLQILCVSDF